VGDSHGKGIVLAVVGPSRAGWNGAFKRRISEYTSISILSLLLVSSMFTKAWLAHAYTYSNIYMSDIATKLSA